MTTDLLDRSIGDLTLREIAHLAEVARVVTAALQPSHAAEVELAPRTLAAPPAAAAPPAMPATPHRSRSAEEIRRDRAAADDQVLEEVQAQVERESVQRSKASLELTTPSNGAKAGKGPGTGRKACPKCHLLSGSRAPECGSCGHRFVAKVR